MKDKGKKLESLVKAVEEIFLPAGFQVTQRRKVYNKKGTQLAEFDLDIRGMVGSKEYGWLIECRDRPSGGPAPSSWIEQLVGRRGRFSFDKVTAVSTTGFSVSATEYATREGIELKTVESITVQGTLNWLSNDSILVTYTRAKKLGVLVPTSIGTERYAAMRAILKAASFNDKVYYHPHDKVSYSLNHLFSWYCKKRPALVSGMKLNSEPKVVNAIIRTPSSVSNMQVITSIGPAEIAEIYITGELYLDIRDILASKIQNYLAQDGSILSESFTDTLEFDVGGQVKEIYVGIHRVTLDGEPTVVRKVDPKK